MKKAVVIILIVFLSNNILYLKNNKNINISKFSTRNSYQKEIIFKKQLQKETTTTNFFLIGMLIVTVSMGFIKNQETI